MISQTELLDRYSQPKKDDSIRVTVTPPTSPNLIGFRNATFGWRADVKAVRGATTPSCRRNFKLRIEGDVFFKRGKINLIIGPTGSGTSTPTRTGAG